MPKTGPSFPDELRAAGLDPGLVGSWNTADGSLMDPSKLAPAQMTIYNQVLAAHNPTTLSARDQRATAFQQDQAAIDLSNRLANATSAQIDAYFAANVTTAAQAIAVLKALVKVVAIRLPPYTPSPTQ